MTFTDPVNIRTGLPPDHWRKLYAPPIKAECPSCGAPNVERAPVCSYCRSSLAG